MRIKGKSAFARVVHLPNTMPQYYVGHQDRVATIRERVAAAPGLFVTGNAFGGVGIPFCIHGGEKTAQEVVDYLRGDQRSERATTGSATDVGAV
jgi:oxygen-dependent protoporphyrinogen oxidase